MIDLRKNDDEISRPTQQYLRTSEVIYSNLLEVLNHITQFTLCTAYRKSDIQAE